MRKTNSRTVWVLLMLTNRCNLRCKLCNIWREKAADFAIDKISDLTGDIVSNNSKISCFGITGGEPFLENKKLWSVFKMIEPDLAKKNIQHCNITTNGSFPSRVLKFINGISKDNLAKISFNVSLDGLEKAHDYLRGKGVFRKVIASLSILKKFGVNTTMNFVINPFNSNQIGKLYKLSLGMGFDFELEVFEPNVPAYYHYFDRVNLPSNNNKDWRREAAREIEGILRQKEVNFNRKQLIALSSYLKTGNKDKDIINECGTPSNLLFIRATGELYSCPYELPLGKIEDFSYRNFTKEREKLSLKIKDRGCRGCLSTMGALSYVE